MNKVHEKLQLNPGLMAALDSFAQSELLQPGEAPPVMETERLYVHRTKDGCMLWSVSKACGMARDILETEDLMRLKFFALRDGMKQAGMDSLYERIMGESIDARHP